MRRVGKGDVIGGFAGATADAFTLFERLEAKLDQYPGQLTRAAVELARDWRTDRYLRRLEAMMIVADAAVSLVLTGTGDVLEPEAGVMGIGSGGNYALAAARALIDGPLDAEAIVRRSPRHRRRDLRLHEPQRHDRDVEGVTPANRKGPPNATMATPDYQGFDPVLAAGPAAAIEAWLRRPHVREWWGDPSERHSDHRGAHRRSRNRPLHRELWQSPDRLPAMLGPPRRAGPSLPRSAGRHPRHRSVHRRARFSVAVTAAPSSAALSSSCSRLAHRGS